MCTEKPTYELYLGRAVQTILGASLCTLGVVAALAACYMLWCYVATDRELYREARRLRYARERQEFRERVGLDEPGGRPAPTTP